MSNTSDLVLRLVNFHGYAWSDVNSNTATPNATPGGLYYCHDAHGARVLQYVRNRNGSDIIMAETMAYEAADANTMSTSAGTITAGTKTSATTSSLTAGDHDGKMFYVLDNADSAKGAPESEVSIVAVNTATLITLESAYPLTTALANADTAEMIANFQTEDAVDGDEAWTLAGVALGRDGISDGNYGWVQKEGPCSVLVAANGITEGDPVVAGAAIMDAFGSDGQELWAGISLATYTDSTLTTALVALRLISHAGPGGTP